jgi:hypothetical protein
VLLADILELEFEGLEELEPGLEPVDGVVSICQGLLHALELVLEGLYFLSLESQLFNVALLDLQLTGLLETGPGSAPERLAGVVFHAQILHDKFIGPSYPASTNLILAVMRSFSRLKYLKKDLNYAQQFL